MSPIVTFISDFGDADGYPAQVKGRILRECGRAVFVDITHAIDPYAIISGAWLLHSAWRLFPAGSIHLAVVDPGVGTARRGLIIEKAGHYFVGPDNGIFSFIYPAERIISLSWRPAGTVAATFHGRDLFAPAVCRLLAGEALATMGEPADDPVSLDTASPMVVHCDRFGNVITNIPAGELDRIRGIECGGHLVGRRAASFSDIGETGLALIAGSQDTIEICANRRSAAAVLRVRPGDALKPVI